MKLNDDCLLERVRSHASAHQSGVACMTVVSAIQDFPPEVQVHAITSAFVLLAERLNVRPATLFTYSDSLINTADGFRPEFKGARAYFENEL